MAALLSPPFRSIRWPSRLSLVERRPLPERLSSPSTYLRPEESPPCPPPSSMLGFTCRTNGGSDRTSHSVTDYGLKPKMRFTITAIGRREWQLRGASTAAERALPRPCSARATEFSTTALERVRY